MFNTYQCYVINANFSTVDFLQVNINENRILIKISSLWSALLYNFHINFFKRPIGGKKLPYLPVYKSIPCIPVSWLPIFEPKNKLFLFLGKNFLEKLIFYLQFFFQKPHGYTKNLSWTFFDLSFWPMYKLLAIFWTDF